jgi:hypothetical protein
MLWLGDVDAVFGFMQDLGRKKKKLYVHTSLEQLLTRRPDTHIDR